MILKPEHFSFFKANGYLILPNVLDPDLCEKARDLLWASLPEDTNIKREDPLTHVGPFIEKDLEESDRIWKDFVGFLMDLNAL